MKTTEPLAAAEDAERQARASRERAAEDVDALRPTVAESLALAQVDATLALVARLRQLSVTTYDGYAV